MYACGIFGLSSRPGTIISKWQAEIFPFGVAVNLLVIYYYDDRWTLSHTHRKRDICQALNLKKVLFSSFYETKVHLTSHCFRLKFSKCRFETLIVTVNVNCSIWHTLWRKMCLIKQIPFLHGALNTFVVSHRQIDKAHIAHNFYSLSSSTHFRNVGVSHVIFSDRYMLMYIQMNNISHWNRQKYSRRYKSLIS